MITRLQFVILCRVEQGLPAFSRPLPAKTFPGTLRRRREAIEDLYSRGYIERARKTNVRRFTCPRLTKEGRRALKWIRNGGEYGTAPYNVEGVSNAAVRMRVANIRRALASAEEIRSRYD